MLTKPSTDVADCLQHAIECERQAERTADPIARASFGDLAKRWRRLAQSYEYTESLGSFLANPKLNGTRPRK